MALQKSITDRILEFLQGSLEYEFEALAARYPEFTWNEFFQEVARLSRAGRSSSHETWESLPFGTRRQ